MTATKKKTTKQETKQARYSKNQKMLTFWFSPDRWGYTYNVRNRDDAEKLIAEHGIAQELVDVNRI